MGALLGNDWTLRPILIAMILLGSVAAGRPVRDGDFRVTDIRAQLLYERTGGLSVDLTNAPDFSIWNTIIGEGSAEEPANDMLVSAVIAGPEQHNLSLPLTITVRDGRGKVLASRTMLNNLADKTLVRSLLVKDIGCAGALQLEARLGTSVRREKLAMDCGE